MSSSALARKQAARRDAVHVLLVEDSPSDAFLLQRMLEGVAVNADYRITTVRRLVDAFNKVESERFNVILLDLNLLDIDGVASVAALHAEAPGTPIIVYSGMDNEKLKTDALMCGATHYLVKGQESAYGLKHMIEQVLN